MQQQSSIKYTIAACFWSAFVGVVLFLPAQTIDPNDSLSLIPGLDKLAHIALFVILTFLIAKALDERGIMCRHITVFIIILLFAGGSELIQSFLIDRAGGVLDFYANVIGIILALLILKR